MKRIVLYILLLFIISYGCSAKKSVVLDETKVLGGKVVVNKVEMKKDVNKYTFLIKANGLRDVNVYYGKNPFALTVVMPNSSLDTETMKFVYSDELVERVSLLPKQDQSIIYVQLKDDVDYSYDITPDGLRLSFKVDKAVVQNVLKSSNWLETVDILNIKTSTFVSDFENLSSNNELLVSIGSDGVAKIDYGYIDANSFYIDFFDVKLVGDKVVYSGLGIVKDVKVVTSLFPQKVRFILNLEKNVNVGLGFLNGKYIISSNPEKLKGTSLYINKIESRTVGKIQGINISSTGKLKYDKKIIDGNLVLIFEDNVRFARDVSPVMYFDGSPIKYVKVGKVQGKPAVVFVADGDIFSKVEDEKGSIVVYSSKDKFAKPAEVDQKQVPKGKVEPSDLVSLSIKDMDIKEAIKLIYYGRGKNIIFGKEVQGKTTIFVKDVHYKTALAAIYRENNLVEIEEDNVIWVISKQRQDEMMAEKAKLQKIVEEEKKTEPLFTEIIPVNYYKASDFDAVVKGVLSPRGKVQVEGKSNSFVVTDTKDAIAKVKSVLKEVDKPTPQVTIEARIVEVLDTNNLALGIQWGTKTSGTTSADFPGTFNFTGNLGTGASGAGYFVNLPAGTPAGALSLTLGSFTGKYGLDLILSALESQNKAKTISSPRITTLDNQEAEIKSGGKAIIVPSGDNTQSQTIDVGIKLKVKPHITANNMIFMEIEVEKSSLGAVSGSTAETQEKKAKTQVLLANGETTVIGGIYEDERQESIKGVPGLQDVPFLGWLFKSKSSLKTKRELLVFITPRINNN